MKWLGWGFFSCVVHLRIGRHGKLTRIGERRTCEHGFLFKMKFLFIQYTRSPRALDSDALTLIGTRACICAEPA
jgi:hypothetical protein